MTKRTCTIPGCDKMHRARGYCSPHYQRWFKYGDPRHLEGVIDRAATPEEAFEKRTRWAGECLVWTGTKVTGYGWMSVHGRRYLVHRWVWEQERGEIPDGLLIDHICRNRSCVRVEHLRLATYKENAQNTVRERPGIPSGKRGVYRTKNGKAWRVFVKHNGQRYYGGQFQTIDEADEAAVALRNKLFTHNDLDRVA